MIVWCFSFLLSFLVVGFGQPAWIPTLGLFASIFGYALFWWKTRELESRQKRFWLAFFWYACVQAIQLSWMTAIVYQGLYILFVYFLVICLLGIQFGVLTLFIPKTGKLRTIDCLSLASFWTLLEWSRLYFFCGFTWNPAGLALTHSIFPMQFAAVWGVFGLSFWVFFINLFTLRVWDRKKNYVILLILCSVPYIYGIFNLSLNQPDKEKQIKVALVQTNLLPPEKIPLKGYPGAFISPFEQWRRIARYLKEAGKEKIDLILLPESAVPYLAGQLVYPYESVKEFFISEWGEDIAKAFPEVPTGGRVSNLFWAQTLSNYYNAELVIGLDDYSFDLKESYQAAFYIRPFSNEIKRYEKKVLVPLAEYLPFDWMRTFTKSYGIEEFYTHGKGAKVFNGIHPLSISICYEEMFPDYMRTGRLQGAELFVNLSNDNWYPDSLLAEQHFSHSRLRTIENGVALVRVCNMGISAAIDSKGQVFGQKTEKRNVFGQQGEVLIMTLPVSNYSTLYTWWGNSGIVLTSLFFIGISMINRMPVKKLAQNL